MTYQKAIDRQHKFHFSINTNDFDLRIKCWKDSLPLCFATNKQNYARYGTYYITQLENIDLTHLSAKEELQETGLSVSRNQFNIRQSIDGAGEQTFMRSSKTTGGVKSFVHQQNAYEKWILNRPFQAKMVQSMLSLVDIDEISSNPRKCLRDHEIRKSEDRVRRIATVLKEDFVNPSVIYQINETCTTLPQGVHFLKKPQNTYFLLKNKDKGYSVTSQKGCTSVKNKLQPSLTLLRGYLGKDFAMPRKSAAKGKTKDVAVQRDILGLLMAVSSKEGAVVDLDKALSYALSTVPLALATSDGIRRKTRKSKLMDAALSSIVTDNVNTDHATCLVIDIIATIRCIAKVPNTFRELVLQLLHQIPSMYQTVLLVTHI